MLRVLIDENLDQRILRGLRLQVPNLNYVIAQETELQSSGDPALLALGCGTSTCCRDSRR